MTFIIIAQDEDMDIIYEQLLQEYGAVSFEAFINLLVSFFSDTYLAFETTATFRLRSPKTRLRLRS